MPLPEGTSPTEESSILHKSKSQDDFGKLKQRLRSFPLLNKFEPGDAVMLATFVLMVSIVCMNALVIFGTKFLSDGAWWAVILLILFIGMVILCYLAMVAHEKNDAFLTFQVGVTLTFGGAYKKN